MRQKSHLLLPTTISTFLECVEKSSKKEKKKKKKILFFFFFFFFPSSGSFLLPFRGFSLSCGKGKMTFKTVVKYFEDNLQYCKELLILMKKVEQIEA